MIQSHQAGHNFVINFVIPFCDTVLINLGKCDAGAGAGAVGTGKASSVEA